MVEESEEAGVASLRWNMARVCEAAAVPLVLPIKRNEGPCADCAYAYVHGLAHEWSWSSKRGVQSQTPYINITGNKLDELGYCYFPLYR